MNTLRCRVCGCGKVESLGKIPNCGEFAGQQVSPSIKGGELWLCKDCGSMFRHPTLSASDYISLYEQAPSTVWVEGIVERNDSATIYTYLKNHVGGTILDVGCYTGNFLAGLPGTFKKYGIEPSDMAAKCAASRGIDVLGKTLDELDSELVFDLVVSIDVIEHVLDVERFLSQCLAHVKENGSLIISTGNPSCFFWKKVFKSRFWYSVFAEHVTFPSFNYYCEFSRHHGLVRPEQIRFRYAKTKFMERLSMLLRYFRFSLLRALSQSWRNICSITTGSAATTSTVASISLLGAFTDHHVIIIKKRDCNNVRGLFTKASICGEK